jgi:hypothetical protein
MDNFKPLGTLIHGIAASEHLDSSGERISIKGLDISSLPKDGVFNWEHKNDQSFQIVGKVLKAKKIFDEKDCETAEELYFWKKSQAPYVYVMGELFDGVGHKGAQEIAAMLKYDTLAKKNGRPGMNVINFSIEGSKLNKEGQEITRSLARKVTITTAACNKVAVAEMLSPSSRKEESLLDFAKSEESGVEMLEKNAKIFKLPQTTTTASTPNKKAKVPYPFESKEEMAAWRSKNKMMDRQSAAGLSGNIGTTAQKPSAPIQSGPQTMAPSNKLFRPGISKAITAGSGMSAPSNKVDSDALSKQSLMSQIVKSSEYPKFLKFISSRYPEMTKDEADAMAKYMTARQLARAEESLEKMMQLDKSKNVREQKKRIFGTDPNAPRTSERRQKMMQQIKNFAEKRFGMPMEVAQGKRDESGKIRTDKDNQPAYDVFSPEGVEKEKKLLAQYKKKGIKRTDPKPDWRSGRLETQPSPDAAVHEMAHVYLAPEGMSPAIFQEEMDRLWGESQSKFGHMQQKKTSGEIQPMSIENPIRRELGLPANRTTKPVKQQERALDYEGDRFVEGKDAKGKKVFYDRQSRLSTPETKERVQQVREGTLKFHPEKGWFKETSPDALINLRGRGQVDEAKARAQARYAQNAAPKKLAASENFLSIMSKNSLYKRCWDGYRPVPGKKPYSKGSCEKE